jgi:hypothetical protein
MIGELINSLFTSASAGRRQENGMEKITAQMDVDNWGNVRQSSERKLKDILDDLVAHVDYYGVEGFKRQLKEYSEGNRSTNIGDGMCVTLGSLRSVCEGNATLNELSDINRRLT